MTEPEAAFGPQGFAPTVVEWQRHAGRHHLPWQQGHDAYRIWLSEIMLQQTQVSTVVPYFQRFLDRFPSIRHLANAPEDDVLAVWSGLGYYARARNLHRAARHIVQHHGGAFPTRFADMVALPGVGRSTAGAIAVFAFGQRFPILDGNVKRLFARCFGIDGYPGVKAVSDRLWQLAERLLSEHDVAPYTQGLMDLGAQVCTRTRPLCDRCPVAHGCVANKQDRIAQLPAVRPRKVRPQRATVMLIMVHDGLILMEKRPALGIWGGLWSFPETDDVASAARDCRSRFDVDIDTTDSLAEIEHAFTHFSLTIRALVCRVKRRGLQAAMPGRVWLGTDEALTSAIPVPVRKLVSALRQPIVPDLFSQAG